MKHSESSERKNAQLELPALIAKLAHLGEKNTHFTRKCFAEIVEIPTPTLAPIKTSGRS